MMPAKGYLRGTRTKLGYFGAWIPSDSIAAGDVGVVSGDYFKKIGTLKDHGVAFQTRVGDGPESLEHVSKTGLNVSAKVAGTPLEGSAIPLQKAGLCFNFSGKEAFVFRANGCKVTAIDNLLSVGESVLEQFQIGYWKKEWHVVDEVVSTESATIIVSHGDSSKLELAADGELKAVGDITANVTVAHESGELTKVLASRATPLFHLSKIKFKLTALKYVFEVLGAAPFDSITPEIVRSDPGLAEALQFDRVRLGDDDGDTIDDSE